MVAPLRLCRCDCGLVLGGLARSVARVTRVDWVAGVDVPRVDVVASGVCVVFASRRAWSLVIGGSQGSVVGCGAWFVSPLYSFFARVCFCLAVFERKGERLLCYRSLICVLNGI